MVVFIIEFLFIELVIVKEGFCVFKLVMYIMIFIVSVLLNSFMFLVLWRKFCCYRRIVKSFIILM